MLSYRHGFHAGHWADVHKHALLVALLGHLAAQDRPFQVLDLFAGDGLYDLTSAEALKTAEFRDGIARIWRRRDGPPGLAQYLALVRARNGAGRLRTYPGSPDLARTLLRDKDRLTLCELHPAAHRSLRAWAGHDRRVSVQRRDGFEALGTLPPPIRHGLVLVDPSYEVKSEYETLGPALAAAIAKWPGAVWALWYPVLPAGRHVPLLEALGALPAAVLRAELRPPVAPPRGLLGTGTIIINPPRNFGREAAEIGAWLAAALWRDPPGNSQVGPLNTMAPAIRES
jgi:23S rRNA (adenine2030-N6)-methyltransferase